MSTACTRNQGDRAATLLMDPITQRKLLAHARQSFQSHIHGMTEDDAVCEAVNYVWQRAQSDPEAFATRSDDQIVGLAYRKLAGVITDLHRRRTVGEYKMALVDNCAPTAVDDVVALLGDDPVEIARNVVAEVFPLVERCFDTPTGFSRWVNTLGTTIINQVHMCEDPVAMRRHIIEAVAPTIPAHRLAPQVRAKTPIPRTAIATLALHLVNEMPITEESTGLSIGTIVTGLHHIWSVTHAQLASQGTVPADARYPARALVHVGAAKTTEEAEALVMKYVGKQPLTD